MIHRRILSWGARLAVLVAVIVLATPTLPAVAINATFGPDQETPESLLPVGDPSAAARAQATLEYCMATGNCTICNVMQVAVRAIQIIVGIIGALALVVFVYGGFRFVLSGGNTKSIETGKSAIKNAVIGLALVLGSWLIVNSVIILVSRGATGFESSGSSGDSAAIGTEEGRRSGSRVFSRGWAEIECDANPIPLPSR